MLKASTLPSQEVTQLYAAATVQNLVGNLELAKQVNPGLHSSWL